MKKHIFAAFALAAVLVGCGKENIQNVTTTDEAPVFHAGFADAEFLTRTYLNESGHLRWNADDRLTIFVGRTLNTQYVFDGEEGDNAGEFKPVSEGTGFATGNPLDANYAVYPYSSSTKITEEGVISLSLPAEQAFGDSSFGSGANTMVAVTEDLDDLYLPFKNVCGYLVVYLYGDATITSVSLTGNNGEKIAGAATLTTSFDGSPLLTMAETATGTITIDCGEGVKTGTSKETATPFWFVVPQTTFSEGITVTATSKTGATFHKSTANTIEIDRNTISTMSALKVNFTSLGAPEMVDLGFESGLKWAACNLGATSPEDYGDYFQWAGQEDVTDTSIKCFWDNCPYHAAKAAYANGWTKYIPSAKSSYWSGSGSADNKTVLDPSDDIAHTALGGAWRMPTQAECEQLLLYCTKEHITCNGVFGVKFTSKTTGQSIFLPAAGTRISDRLTGAGTYGNYWTSTLDDGRPYNAYVFNFNRDTAQTSGDSRSNGYPVRPVYAAPAE